MMVPLSYYGQLVMPICTSYQVETTHSSAHQCTGDILNNQPVTKVKSCSRQLAVSPLQSNQKIQSYPIATFPMSPEKNSQNFYSRALKSPLSNSKHLAIPSVDFHWRTSSLSPNQRALRTHFPYPKPQATSLLDLKMTSSSTETNQRAINSSLPLSKSQSISSPDLYWTSATLKSNQQVLSSSFQNQETSSLGVLWTSSSLAPCQRAHSSILPQCKTQKTSLNCIWTSLLEHKRRSLSLPLLNFNTQTNDFFGASSSLGPHQMTLGSTLPNARPKKTPVLKSSLSALSLPSPHSKSWKKILPFSVHQTQSLPLFQPKSQAMLTFDHDFQTLNIPDCHSKLQRTTLASAKPRATDSTSCHPKQNVLGHSSSRSDHCIKETAASTLVNKLHNKTRYDLCANTESNKEFPWTLDYSQPCIVKGGSIPDDVVKKILSSISMTRIQRDLSRQILFRRMRGRPNPHPGPRISSSYMVCLLCASCIKFQCNHLTGRKDPRSATLFVIPTPKPNSEGEIEVKLVPILSLPEISFSYFSVEEKHIDQVPDDLEGMEKTSPTTTASEPDIIQGTDTKKNWLAVASQNKVISQQPQTTEWLLYVKKSSSSQLKSQASSSSSSSSSCSSSSRSIPGSSSTVKDDTISTLPDCVFSKGLSDHRLPPGVSWLEFIKDKNHQPLPGKPHKSQSSCPKIWPVRNSTTVKDTKGPNILLKFFQTKFQNERNLD